MRTFIVVAVCSGVAFLGGTPASAAPSDAVPGCVATTFYRPFDTYLAVDMTNNCADAQRVTPTFTYTEGEQPPCFALKPGRQETYSKRVQFAWQHDFTGLVHC